MLLTNSHGVCAETLAIYKKKISIHTLVIRVKLLKEFIDKVKSGKNPYPDNWTATSALMCKKTYTNPCDSD